MAPRVRLPQGTYEGRVQTVGQGLPEWSSPDEQPPLPKPLDAFLGIPYAQSTAGANRFRAPVPLDTGGGRQDEVHSAKQFGPRCIGSDGRADVPEGEDCLNANVYVPRGRLPAEGQGSRQQPMPVIIYVHGGGFNNGLGAERDMASFAGHADVDLVAVSFNYRVGALGFLGWLDHDSKDGEDGEDGEADDAPLNLGLRDQQALFEWVQANIGFFGGDAHNVTIMGLSAGAHSIGHHLLYYRPGQALFHKAILESGAPTARAVLAADHPRPRAQLQAFLVAAGVLSDGEDAVLSSERQQDIIHTLRNLPIETVVRASRAVWNNSQASVCWPFQPAVDALLSPSSPSSSSSSPLPSIIPRTPIAAWQAAAHAHVPVLTGFNSHEGTVFVPGDADRADTDAHFRSFFAQLIPSLTPADLDALEALYPSPTSSADARYRLPADRRRWPPGVTGRQWVRIEAAYAHYAYICPVLQTGHYLVTTAAAADHPVSVYVYEFAALATGLGTANHGDNAPVVAHDMAALQGQPGLQQVAAAMHGAWVRFAASPRGDMGEEGLSRDGGSVPWTPFVSPLVAPSAESIMVFGAGNNERVPAEHRHGGSDPRPGTPAAMRSLTPHELEQCQFWWDRVGLSEGYGQRSTPSSLPSRL